MTTIEYIHQELEQFLNRNGGVITGRLWCDAQAVLDFIDSLEPSLSSDVDEAAETFAESIWKEMRYELVYDNLTESFIAGAEWQKSQMLEDVEFDSQVFGKVMSDILAVYKSPSNPEEEPFDYEWTIARQFYELGKKNMKEQMLKDAVEGKIYGYEDGSYELVASWLDLPKGGIYKDGDKVRIVMLKEEG